MPSYARHARQIVSSPTFFVIPPPARRPQYLPILTSCRFHSWTPRKRSPSHPSLLFKSHLPLSSSALTSSLSGPRMGCLRALDDPLHYPLARRDESVVDDFHGVKIADPYRWLEDPDAEEVKEFVQKQVKLTDSVLQLCDTREKLRENITKLFDHPRYNPPFRRANKYFYFHNTGLQPQDVLYMQDTLEGEPVVLLDPNVLSEDGTVSLSTLSVSEDAKYLAYGLSSSGSDWVTIKVLHIEDKNAEPDILSLVKFSSISWTHDRKGLFYSRYPAPKDGEVVDAGTETNSNLYHGPY